LARSAGVVQW